MRKAYPKKYAKWTDYIKAASKKISGLDSVKRSGSKTTVHYSRKVATKKTAPKATQAKLFGTKTHKDTRSHNVNVRVVSGLKTFDHYTVRDKIEKDLRNARKLLEDSTISSLEYVKTLPTSERAAYRKFSNSLKSDIKKIISLKEKELKQQNSFLRKIEKFSTIKIK
jgi:hypothetical protein